MSRFGAFLFGFLFVFMAGVVVGMAWNGDNGESGDDPAPASTVHEDDQPNKRPHPGGNK